MTDQQPPRREQPAAGDEPAIEDQSEPEPVPEREPAEPPAAEAADEEAEAAPAGPEPAAAAGGGRWRWRLGASRLVMLLLLGLLGFSLAIQVSNVAEDPTVAALDEEDLVRILANLDAHEQRLEQELAELESTQRRLTTTGETRQEALAEATRRADELGILAGTLPAEGPGITVRLAGPPAAVDAFRLLDAVQELRGASAEAIEIQGAEGDPVRLVASSYFLDAEGGGILVDGQLLRGPYTLVVIGEPETLAPALRIPGGVVESVEQDGGTVTVQQEPGGVQVTAVRQPDPLQYARPDS